MTAAALRCAVISDPRIFENEPACTCNYSSSDYMVVKGFPLPLLFFFFPFNFTSFILCSKQTNATDGERTLSGS